MFYYSKPEYQGNVFTNGTDYVGLYKRQKFNDATATATDEYYYMQTNPSGNILDTRDNVVNGIFSSQANALANKPSGYDNAFVDFQSIKSIGYNTQELFEFDESVPKAEFDAAIAAGASYIMIIIEWGQVFQTWAQQTTNADASWEKYDKFVDYVVARNNYLLQPMKVSFRIRVDMDDGLHNDINGTNTSGFYNLSDNAKDEYGYVARIDRGSGHVSLAYTTGVNQMLDFVQKVLYRYYNRIGNKFFWFSVVTSAQTENGYNFENQYYTPDGIVPKYSTSFDFSDHAVNGFKAAMETKYTPLGGISALNTAWGNSPALTSFSQITAPSRTGATADSIYNTNKGKDWWWYQSGLLKSFLSACRSLGSTYAPGVGFTLEWGSVRDLPRRMSIDVASMPSYSDMMKSECGKLNHKPDLSITLDIFRSNYVLADGSPKRFGTELNSYDLATLLGAPNVSVMKDYALQQGKAVIENGGKDLLIISSKRNDSYFITMMDVLSELRNYMNGYDGTVTTSTTVNYSLGQMLENIDILQNVWERAGGGNSTRVKMLQSSDLGITADSCAYPLSIYPLHSFCLYNNSIKSDLFENGSDALKIDYRANKVRFLAPTHAITYPTTGGLAKARWRIVGADGITYVRNEQFEGWREDVPPAGQVPDIRNNNHPDKRYGAFVEDSVFYLPANQSYTIYMTNTGTENISFEVDTLDPNNLGVKLSKLTPGAGEQSFTINAATIAYNDIRTIKLNCNRRFDTDLLP